MKTPILALLCSTILFSQSAEKPAQLKLGTAMEKQVDSLAKNAASKETKNILILTAQGIDPTIDTISFNDMVRRITQAFSSKLQPMLELEGKLVNNVIDQSIKLQPGQKLAYYSNKYSADATIILLIDTVDSADDTVLLLKVQYFDLIYATTDNKVSSVLTSNEIRKEYSLKSSKTGASKLTITDLATDFRQVLKAAKRL